MNPARPSAPLRVQPGAPAFSRRAACRLIGLGAPLAAAAARAQPLSITVEGEDFEPIPIAFAPFVTEPDAAEDAAEIAEVAQADLVGSGLFRAIDPRAFLQTIENFDAAPRYADWRAINAAALVTGRAANEADGRLRVDFRLFDVAAGRQVEGLQLRVDPSAARRVGHKIADAIYARLTGEGPYFDSRIVFVDETGSKGDRTKRLAIMDQDGANVRFLTDGRELVLSPRFSPTDQTILYISYAGGRPGVALLDLDTGRREALGRLAGMSFAPRFSPDGRRALLSMADETGTDIYEITLATRRVRRLTSGAAIETAPSYAPEGDRIVFESDRGGGPQLYVMEAGGGDGSARRISFGSGRYGTPVWSPRGDQIAFTRFAGGKFEIGVMRPDGSGERILDSSFHSEGPSWAPNGRVLSFFRESPGARGAASIHSVDVAGFNLKRLTTPNAASDPAWSPLLPS